MVKFLVIIVDYLLDYINCGKTTFVERGNLNFNKETIKEESTPPKGISFQLILLR